MGNVSTPLRKTATPVTKAVTAVMPPSTPAAMSPVENEAAPPSSENPTAVVAAAVMAVMERVCETYDTGAPESVCVHAHTLADMAVEELQKLSESNANDVFYRAAACIAGARAHDMNDTPTCTARHALLLQAYELAESATISFGFVEEPCEALAKGIKAGRAMETIPKNAEAPSSFDAEAASGEALALSQLVAWISEASNTLADVRSAAFISQELSDRLRAYGICYGSPEWTGEVGDGVTYVLRHQRELIRQLAGAAA